MVVEDADLDGLALRVGAVAPGGLIAELSLFEPGVAAATATATEATRLLRLSHDALGTLREKHPKVASLLLLALIEDLAARVRHANTALVAGAQLLRRFAATPALAAVIDSEIAPGPQVQSRAQLVEDIHQRASSVFHPVGTCRMGPDARAAVVDHRLRVHGLAGLRIVDASVFPAVTSGNTNAPVIMVAEKGAEMILADAAAT